LGFMHQLDWNAAIDSMREYLPVAQFQNWVKPLEFIRCSDNALVLGVPSRFHEDWVRHHYSGHIQKAIRKQVGADLQLTFEILVQEENVEAALAPLPSAPAPTPTPTRPALRIVPSHSDGHGEEEHAIEAPVLPIFQHPFMEMPYNHVAYQCANMFASGKHFPMNPLILLGGIGMGKTHLLTEIGQQVRAQNPRARIRFTNFESFSAEMVTALRSNDIHAFKRKYREGTDCLLFDDIQGLTKRLKTQEELLHIFNEIVARGGRIAFTSSVAPQRLEEFIEPLRSRLLSGVMAEIKPPSFEERVEILSRMSIHSHMAIDPLVLRSMADKGQKDVRELIGSLFRVHLQAKLENRTLDDKFLAKEGWVQESQRSAITLSEIISLVEHNYGVSREDLASKSRKTAVSWARQVAMYLARKHTLLSLEEIGKNFGRDHATVIHAFQKVSETMETQPTKKYEVEFLKQKLESHAPCVTPDIPLRAVPNETASLEFFADAGDERGV